MSTQIPTEAMMLMHDGWELSIRQGMNGEIPTGRFYVEMFKWGWAKNGSRRRRICTYGYAPTITEAIQAAVARETKKTEPTAAT